MEHLLGRMLDAIGGADALRAMKSLELLYDMEVGTFSGTLRSTFDFDRKRFRYDADLGAFQITDGFDGKVVWKVDHTGKLRVWSDADREGERLVLTFSYNQYLLDPDAFEFSVEEEGAPIRLRITSREHSRHPFGSVVVDVDPASGRIVRRQTMQTGQAGVEVVHEAAWYDGILLSSSITEIDAAGNETRTRLRSATINPQIDDSLFAPPATDLRDYRFLDGGSRCTVPIRIPVDHIFVDVLVAGHPARFIVDTGAGATVLSFQLRDRLGLTREGKLMAQGVGGAQEFEFVRVPELRIGGVALIDQRIISMDLGEVGARLIGLDGILGMDFLTRFVVKLDYVAGEMEVVERGAFDPEGKGEAIKIDRAYVPVTFDGHRGKCQIDTGAGSFDIHAPFVRRYNLVSDPETVPSLTALSGLGSGKLTKYLALAREVRLGSYTLHDVPMGLSETEEGVFSNERIMGNVGGVIWRRFVTWFDFDGETIYISPNVNFNDPFPRPSLGVTLKLCDGAYEVDAVIRRSPAWKAGIVRGDRIAALDGRPAAELTLDELTQAFRGPAGSELRLDVLRNGEELALTVRLEDYLDYCQPPSR